MYAFAVNEEDAAGGRVVAAPTHGAVGVIPAVLHCYDKFMADAPNGGVIKFLLTAAATGILYKRNASISDAKVAFEGEVGVAMFHGGGWFGGRSDELEAGYEDALLLITLEKAVTQSRRVALAGAKAAMGG